MSYVESIVFALSKTVLFCMTIFAGDSSLTRHRYILEFTYVHCINRVEGTRNFC